MPLINIFGNWSDFKHASTSIKRTDSNTKHIEVDINKKHYTDLRDAVKQLNINKVVFEEISKTVNNDMKNKFIQSMADAPSNNINFRMMPKIKLKDPSKASETRRLQKMEAKELKSGIARYLLARISKNLTKRIKKSPFAKVISLPQMLGYGDLDRQVKFNYDRFIGFWKFKQMTSWMPNSREYATWTYIDGSLVLFGGLNNEKMNDITIFDLRSWKWQTVNFEVEDYVPETRYGHSAVSYNSKVIIYGGYRRYVTSFKVRDTYGDVAFFDTDTMKWDKPLWCGMMTFRRHHVATVIGRHMIVHGGLNENSWTIDSIYSLNLNTFRWLECTTSGTNPGKVSHHKCCVVLYPERK